MRLGPVIAVAVSICLTYCICWREQSRAWQRLRPRLVLKEASRAKGEGKRVGSRSDSALLQSIAEENQPPSMAPPLYDIVVYGASGFTVRLSRLQTDRHDVAFEH